MTLSDLSSIVSVISGLAVLGSLVYLAQQTRQNAKHTRALIQQGRSIQITDSCLRYAEDASLTDIRSRGDQGDKTLDRLQIARYRWATVSAIYNFEDQFHQHQDRLIGEDKFAGWLNLLEARFQSPGFRWMWNQNRNNHGPDFQNFMDDIMKRTHIVARPDIVEAWKAGIEAELSKASA